MAEHVSIKNFFLVLCLIVCFLTVAHLLYMNKDIHQQLQEIKEIHRETLKSFAWKTKKKDGPGSCKVPPLVDLEDFFNYGKIKGKTSCINIGEFGGNYRNVKELFPYNEAARIVCLDGVKFGNCTVMSFGIGKDFTFEMDMADIVHCQVYMFDPTTDDKNFDSPPRKKFFNLGISDHKGTINVDDKVCEVDRYEGILQKLNLTHHLIDYLKIDVETSDLTAIQDILVTSPHLLDNVRQLGMELHPVIHRDSQGNMTLQEAFQPFWKIMRELECRGFELISFVPNLFPVCKFNYNGKEVSGCYDVVFLNSVTN